jgi:hypothetical protein
LNKEFSLFTSLFDNTPSLALLYLKGDGFLEKRLTDIIEKNSGTIKTITTDSLKILNSREYEYAIIESDSDEIDEELLKKIYHSLENSAFIIILFPKESNSTLRISYTLEQLDFRAVNSIDIFENYHLVMGKKLHMWGNGL